MITANVYRNNGGCIFAFKITGHGSKPVCAAVSFLAQNTANSLEKFTDRDINCEWDEKGGYMSFELPALRRGDKDEKAQLLLDSMFLGLDMLFMQHPEDIRIIIKEAVKC